MIRMVISVFCVAIFLLETDAACERSLQMVGAEDICWGRKVELTERIQYTTKSVLNFAKKKLGLEVDENNHPQKCDYYQCIFQELKMLNEHGYPKYEKIVQWIDNNVIYKQATELYNQLTRCNQELTRSIASNSFFSGDQSLLSSPVDDLPPLQGDCEISQEFIKCLTNSQTDCEIFKYP